MKLRIYLPRLSHQGKREEVISMKMKVYKKSRVKGNQGSTLQGFNQKKKMNLLSNIRSMHMSWEALRTLTRIIVFPPLPQWKGILWESNKKIHEYTKTTATQTKLAAFQGMFKHP